MHVPSLIEKKRDGGELSSEEIAQVISGFTRGEIRSEEHTSELQSLTNLVCRLLLEKKKTGNTSAVSATASTSCVTRSSWRRATTEPRVRGCAQGRTDATGEKRARCQATSPDAHAYI